MKIVYCTVSVHHNYHLISKSLLDSFLKFTTDSLLLVLTDDANFYQSYSQYQNIIILEDKELVTGVPSVNLNVKYRLLQKAYEYNPEYIILVDCDAYITDHIDNEWFRDLPVGINVVIGDVQPASKIQNPTIRKKLLAFNPDENHKYFLFREGTLVLHIGGTFLQFVQEWESLYNYVITNRLTHTSELFEINIASEKAGYPINNLGIHPIRSVIWMAERVNGGLAIAPALR